MTEWVCVLLLAHARTCQVTELPHTEWKQTQVHSSGRFNLSSSPYGWWRGEVWSCKRAVVTHMALRGKAVVQQEGCMCVCVCLTFWSSLFELFWFICWMVLRGATSGWKHFSLLPVWEICCFFGGAFYFIFSAFPVWWCNCLNTESHGADTLP